IGADRGRAAGRYGQTGYGVHQLAGQGGALMKRERGFTLVEVIVAILVLTVGLLALVTSSALVTRMIQRGQRSAVSSNYGGQQLWHLAVTGYAAQLAVSD